MKILILGNEFIQEDSFAKEISKELAQNHEIINIKDSFQFMEELQNKEPENSEEIVIIDVVQNLQEVKILKINDLSENKILSAHDMDASFFLQLLNPDVKIIGLPQKPTNQEHKQKILEQVQSFIK